MSSPESISHQLAGSTATLEFSGVPKKVADHARLMLADTVGVAIAGKSEAASRAVLDHVSHERGSCVVWGTSVLTTAGNAALANGAFAHALDFDDNNMSMIGHSSAPVLPAVLALADELQTSMADVLVAYIAGVQVESVLGRIATLEHNARGWHTTATLGTFGAAAACARLLKLDQQGVAHALGIAASMTGGIRQNFPSMTKALHAGFAASNGLRAARLAAAGITSAQDALDGPEGFLALFAGVHTSPVAADGFGGFEILESFPKVYPTCSMVHQALDLVLDAIAAGVIRGSDVQALEVHASYHALNIMRYDDPHTVPECRFSMEYCLAVALVHGQVSKDHFAADRLFDPAVRQMMSRIHVRLAAGQEDKVGFEKLYLEGKAFTQVRVTQRNREPFVGQAALQKGHPGNPLTVAAFRSKFMQCVQPEFGEQRGADLWSTLTTSDAATRFRPAQLLIHTR